jgi:hypothetical protein
MGRRKDRNAFVVERSAVSSSGSFLFLKIDVDLVAKSGSGRAIQ